MNAEMIDIINELIEDVNYYSWSLVEHLCEEDCKRMEKRFARTEEIVNRACDLINKTK